MLEQCTKLGWVEVSGVEYLASHCSSLWAAAYRLAILSESREDATSVASRAAAIALEYKVLGDEMLYCVAVQDWVKRHVSYQPDPVSWHTTPIRAELFQSPSRTLARGAGDCDDQARLVKALLRVAGIQAQLWFLGTRETPSHVACKAQVAAMSVWLETTLDAWPGEHPVSAYLRLHRA
jgi:transglutaminase-like putative cysteine protease